MSKDKHEGDLPRIIVVVERPSENSYVKLRGFVTAHHGSNDIIECINEYFVCPITGENPAPPYYLGEHHFVYSSAGSHAMYDDFNAAYDDDAGQGIPQPCNPLVSAKFVYLPGEPPLAIEGNPNIPDICKQSGVVYARYKLIDIFEEGPVSDGLWQQRFNDSVFTDVPIQEQEFQCNNGNCSKRAPAPWKNPYGVNPISWIHEHAADYNCECQGSAPCDPITFSECLYEYNPYLCEFYDIVMPRQLKYNDVWEDNPHPDGQDLVVAFQFNALDVVPANADVTWCWELPAGFNNPVTCIGCSQTPVNNCVTTEGNNIVLKIANASIEDLMVNPEEFKVTATADFIECGTIQKEFSMLVQLENIINTDTVDCEKMVFEIKDTWHTDGNVYNWSFPSYDALAGITNGGRRVEFNTQAVIQQSSTTTNPDMKLQYNLTVSNPSYTSDIQLSGERQIPDCTYGGLGLTIYPNPAINEIQLAVDGIQPDEPLDIRIFNHQFNRVKGEKFFLQGQSIDVSSLDNGLYFLCAITKDGKMLTRKFCIGRH